MTATITSIIKQPSKYGGEVYLITFKDAEGKSGRSYITPQCRNFARWKPVIELFNNKPESIVLNNLTMKNQEKRLIDADSLFSLTNEKK